MQNSSYKFQIEVFRERLSKVDLTYFRIQCLLDKIAQHKAPDLSHVRYLGHFANQESIKNFNDIFSKTASTKLENSFNTVFKSMGNMAQWIKNYKSATLDHLEKGPNGKGIKFYFHVDQCKAKYNKLYNNSQDMSEVDKKIGGVFNRMKLYESCCKKCGEHRETFKSKYYCLNLTCIFCRECWLEKNRENKSCDCKTGNDGMEFLVSTIGLKIDDGKARDDFIKTNGKPFTECTKCKRYMKKEDNISVCYKCQLAA